MSSLNKTNGSGLRFSLEHLEGRQMLSVTLPAEETVADDSAIIEETVDVDSTGGAVGSDPHVTGEEDGEIVTFGGEASEGPIKVMNWGGILHDDGTAGEGGLVTTDDGNVIGLGGTQHGQTHRHSPHSHADKALTRINRSAAVAGSAHKHASHLKTNHRS